MFPSVVNLAKNSIMSVINWANNGQTYIPSATPDEMALRRAAYDCNFKVLFPDWTKLLPHEPLLTPDKTIEWVVDKFATNLYPSDTSYQTADQTTTELLQQIIEQTLFVMKTDTICQEAALMGLVGLRSVWSDLKQQWLLEIKPREQLNIVTDPDSRDIITAIEVSYPLTQNNKYYWYKERWTDTQYFKWPLKEVAQYQKTPPEFKENEASVEPNTFGEIPITLVWHTYDPDCLGDAAISCKDILDAKCLIRLRNKRHFSHLEHMDPTVVVVNDDGDSKIRRGVGQLIRVKSPEPRVQADVKLLESKGVPESVKDEILETTRNIFKSAGLTPPTDDDIISAGTDVAGVALRIRDKGEAETIKTLREKGYSQVLRHLDKLLRMGARTRKLPAYSAVNLADSATWSVEAKFADFFPPTDQDILLKMQILKMSHLSDKEKAEREAQYMGVDAPEEVQAIMDNLAHERDLMEANTVGPGNPNGG